jgi:hypothetical protein
MSGVLDEGQWAALLDLRRRPVRVLLRGARMMPTPTEWCRECGEPTTWKGCTGEPIGGAHVCPTVAESVQLATPPSTWLRIEGDRAIVEVTGALMNYHRRGEGWSAGLEPNKVYEIEVGVEQGEWTHANPTTPTGVIVPEGLRAIALEAVRRSVCPDGAHSPCAICEGTR